MQQRTDFADQIRKGRKIYLFDSFIEAQVVRKAMQNIYINSCRPHKPRREYFFFFHWICENDFIRLARNCNAKNSESDDDGR